MSASRSNSEPNQATCALLAGAPAPSSSVRSPEHEPSVDDSTRHAAPHTTICKDDIARDSLAGLILGPYAQWDLLVARDIRYSEITTWAAESATVASQHVRLLEDSVNNSQANCVDGRCSGSR